MSIRQIVLCTWSCDDVYCCCCLYDCKSIFNLWYKLNTDNTLIDIFDQSICEAPFWDCKCRVKCAGEDLLISKKTTKIDMFIKYTSNITPNNKYLQYNSVIYSHANYTKSREHKLNKPNMRSINQVGLTIYSAKSWIII